MTRTPVQSSDIVSIGYDETARTMEVEFVRGNRVYVYRDVPPTVYRALLTAKSVGAAFAAHVKGKYEYREVKDA